MTAAAKVVSPAMRRTTATVRAAGDAERFPPSPVPRRLRVRYGRATDTSGCEMDSDQELGCLAGEGGHRVAGAPHDHDEGELGDLVGAHRRCCSRRQLFFDIRRALAASQVRLI